MKFFDPVRPGDVIAGEKTDHLTAGHLGTGSLCDQSSIRRFFEITGDTDDLSGQVGQYGSTVFVGGEVYNQIIVCAQVFCY